jgi:hypothetical protein
MANPINFFLRNVANLGDFSQGNPLEKVATKPPPFLF